MSGSTYGSWLLNCLRGFILPQEMGMSWAAERKLLAKLSRRARNLYWPRDKSPWTFLLIGVLALLPAKHLAWLVHGEGNEGLSGITQRDSCNTVEFFTKDAPPHEKSSWNKSSFFFTWEITSQCLIPCYIISPFFAPADATTSKFGALNNKWRETNFANSALLSGCAIKSSWLKSKATSLFSIHVQSSL